MSEARSAAQPRSPEDTLNAGVRMGMDWQRANRAEVAVEEIMAALRSMRELASVAHNGDPWYAENEGLDAGAIFKQAREALGEPDA